MNKKRFVCFAFVFILCLSLFTFPVISHASEQVNLQKLYAFGITQSASDDMQRMVTRAEMVKYVVGLYGMDIPAQNNTPYDDVSFEHKFSGAVNFASDNNIISKQNFFFPDRTVKFEEAVKMIVSALNYEYLAQRYGGYPNGYIRVAAELKLFDGVSAKTGDELTLDSAAKLMSNALDATVFNIEEEYATNTESVLRNRFNVSVYDAFITDINTTKLLLNADIVRNAKNDDTKATYKAGDKVVLNISSKTNIPDCKYTYAEIYVNDDEVLYVEVDKNIEVLSGVIYEVNKSHNKAPQNPSYINTIAYEDSDDYLDVASSCIMEFNDKEVKHGKSYNYVGAFARAVVYKDEIIALEAWDLSEGGIITEVTDDEIEYTKGERTGLILDNIGAYEKLTVYVNGKEADYLTIVNDVIFDWFATEDKEHLIIAISTNAVTEMFDTTSGDTITVGGEEYSLSEKYKVNYSNDGKVYSQTAGQYDLLGRMVTVYLDAAGYVRYVKSALDSGPFEEYFAIIVGYEENNYENPEFLMYLLKDDTIEKAAYPISEAFVKKNSALISYIRTEIGEITSASAALKNDAIKGADVFYKVRINANDEIVKVTAATRFAETTLNKNYKNGTDGLLFSSEFSTSAVPHITSPRINFPDAKICLFYYSAENGLQVKLVGWKDLSGRECTGILITPFAEYRSSKINLVLLRGDAESIKITRSDYVKRGLCTDIRKGYDKETEREHLIVRIDGNDYIASKYKDMFADIKDAAYVLYSEGNSLVKNNEIVPVKIFNLSGTPDSWALSEAMQEGLHRDEIDFIDSERIYFKSGDIWYFDNGAPVYEVVESNGKVRFIEFSRGSVPEGAECWYIYQYYQARALFFVR